MSLTDIGELDRLILMDLDDLSLAQACQSNRWLYRICSDDLFWRERLKRRFGHEIMVMKPSDESYYQMYVRLAQLQYTEDQIRKSAKEGHLDELLVLKEAGVTFPLSAIEEAASRGHLDVVKWMLEILNASYPRLSKTAMKAAVRGNHLELAQWLNQHYPGLIRRSVVQTVFLNGGPKLLNWLVQQGHIPNAADMSNAFAGQNIEAIDWLIQRGIWPTALDFIAAVEHGRTSSLEHMYQQYGQLPQLNQVNINNAARFGSLMSLIWLEQHGLGYPDTQAVQAIVQFINNWGYHRADAIRVLEPILIWLSQRGIRA